MTQRRLRPGTARHLPSPAPLASTLALAALCASATLGCTEARSSAPPTTAYGAPGYAAGGPAPGYAPPPGYAAGPPPAPASPGAEGYVAQAMRQLGSALLYLPGIPQQQQVTFETVNGQAIMDGDILLGPATALLYRYGMPRPMAADQRSAVAVASQAYLWPNNELPYVIDPSALSKQGAIEWAVQQFATTTLRVRPRTAADPDYVVFRWLGQGCMSNLGRQGGAQDIDVTSCQGGNLVHELMHAAGFYHEQSRGDRDQYVTIVWDEIAPEMRSNFEMRDARGQDIGAYDYGSIMHYGSTAFSRSGRATIVPRQANVRIGQREGLSALDRSALESLYPARGARSPAPVASAPAPAAMPPAAMPPAAMPPAAMPSLPIPMLPLPAPTPAPAPAPAPAPTPAPAPPVAPAPLPAPTPTNASFTGSYDSARGLVSCSEGGLFVNCQYPGGTLFCAASGTALSCTWSGGGQGGRAAFQRQSSGVIAGTYGDGFSADSRGRWDLTPRGASAPAAGPAPSSPAPSGPAPSSPAPSGPAPSVPAPAASTAATSLGGNFQSSRGPMTCTDGGTSVSCNFTESDGTSGRVDCAKSQSGLELSCAWITFLPRPATGRAVLTRQSPASRQLTGTWGLFLAPSGGGTWNMTGQ